MSDSVLETPAQLRRRMRVAVFLLVLSGVAFLGALAVIFGWIVPALTDHWATANETDPDTAYAVLLVVAIVGLLYVINFVKNVYLTPSGQTNARPLPEDDEPELYETVRRLAAQFDLPAPDLRIVYSNVPNAYATGVRTDSSSIVVTAGLLETLGQDEIEGVLAHELAHIKNRDGAVMSVAYLLPSILFALVPVFSASGSSGGPPKTEAEFRERNEERASRDWSLPKAGNVSKRGAYPASSSTGTARSSGGGGNGNAIVGLLLIIVITVVLTVAVSVVLWIFTVIVVGLLAHAREHAADRAAVAVTGDPAALARALETLDEQMLDVPERDLREMDGAVESLYAAPLKRGLFDGWGRTFGLGRYLPDTHPSTADRIERLQAMKRNSAATGAGAT